MKTALLDINILTALLWPAHEHHEVAHTWFADAYLLAVAHRRKGVLAKFDRGLRTLAGDTLSGSLELVHTR